MWKITEEEVKALSPDSRAFTAAKKHAKLTAWRRIGADGDARWGVAVGSDGANYATFVASPQSLKCSCPSRKLPCKHALGLLLLMAHGHEFEQVSLPVGHRYSS